MSNGARNVLLKKKKYISEGALLYIMNPTLLKNSKTKMISYKICYLDNFCLKGYWVGRVPLFRMDSLLQKAKSFKGKSYISSNSKGNGWGIYTVKHLERHSRESVHILVRNTFWSRKNFIQAPGCNGGDAAESCGFPCWYKESLLIKILFIYK